MTDEQSAMSLTVEDFLSYVKETKSKHTFKEYRIGIEKFSKWFGKSANEILEMRKEDWVSGNLHRKKRFTREIEKYHKWLIENQKYSINTARNYCLGILQLFRYYEMPITIPTGSNVSKTVISTKDFVPTPQQYREMYKVADSLRDKLIVSMGKDLGWRIGDFVKIQKDILPILDADAPIPFELMTEKEDVLAKSFLSQETVDLLKEYLATVKDNPNPYLFPSNRDKFIDTDTINNVLRTLSEKAKIRMPRNKRLRFHCFRKRFLSECANLSVDINTAKILVGKNVEKDMLTYLSEVEHKEAFLKVHQKLRLTETEMRKRRETTSELERKVEDLQRLVHGVIALGGKDLVEKAKHTLELEDKDLWLRFKDSSTLEMIKQLGEIRRRKQREEYRKLIMENNNTNNH